MKILFGFLLITTTAFADSYMSIDNYPSATTLNLKYGIGILQNQNTEMVSLGLQNNFYKSFAHQVECGAWVNNKPSKADSLNCEYSLGLRVLLTSLYAESMHGLGFITSTDKLLGSNFEFFHDVGFGIKDSSGNSLGVLYKHTSNAGLSSPNIGRNYFAVKLGFGL